MKQFNIKTTGALLLTLFMLSCSNILDEKPRSTYTVDFLKTSQGVSAGIASLYSNLRNIYGNCFYYAGMQAGTDESTYGALNNGDSKNDDMSGAGSITSLQNSYAAIWTTSFPSINTSSSVIENGSAAGVDKSLVAEARFFRAYYYFLLVQTFGGVPLDLGSGELKSNINPTRTSVRNTVPEVYSRGIFPDLLQAVTDLPAKSRLTGTVNTTVAQLVLAKAYLTYAWWLKNPQGIPTYPDAARTDPDGHDAAYYYQKAYDISTAAIATHDASIALEAYYYDVNVGSNDHGKEWLLYADHTQGSDLYNGSPVNEFASQAPPRNEATWMTNFNYTQVKFGTTASLSSYGASSGLQREAGQEYGRPFVSVAPTRELLMNIFADKTNDSRFDGTFQTVYHANFKKGSAPVSNLSAVFGANLMPVAMDQPGLSFLDTDPGITFPAGAGDSGIGAGTLPGRADWILLNSNVSRLVFPSLWKIGTYRTDNNGGLGAGVNAGLTRPFPAIKFSELYFIAAEAATQGATGAQSARDLINVIRARAGKWRYRNNDRVTVSVDNSLAMTTATPAIVDLNYVLDERSREYYGEGFRWFDLVRTQTWATRAATYSIAGTSFGDRTPATVTRTIPNSAWLRPIPQATLDAFEMTSDQKAAYQNPGY